MNSINPYLTFNRVGCSSTMERLNIVKAKYCKRIEEVFVHYGEIKFNERGLLNNVYYCVRPLWRD